MRKLTLLLILRLTLGLMFGTTYYVSKSGSDSNSGANPTTQSFLTIAKCISVVVAGDTCEIRTGTYNEFLYYTIGAAGTPVGTSYSNAITLKTYNSEVVVLKANGGGRPCILCWDSFSGHTPIYWNIQGLIFDGDHELGANSSIGGLDVDYVRLQDVEVKNNVGVGLTSTGDHWDVWNMNQHDSGHDTDTTHGVYMNGQYVDINGGQFHDNTGYGLQLFLTSSWRPSFNTVSNTRIYNNYTGHLRTPQHGGGGLILASGQGNVAFNNLIYNNFGSGIDIDYHCGQSALITTGEPCQVINNTLYGNEGGVGLGANSNYDVVGTVVKNNIIVNGGGVFIQGTVVTPDCVKNLSDTMLDAACTGTVSGNPLFTNAGSSDFTIAFNSPAVAAGVNLWNFRDSIRTDFAGIMRANSAFDIGAYTFTVNSIGNSTNTSKLHLRN